MRSRINRKTKEIPYPLSWVFLMIAVTGWLTLFLSQFIQNESLFSLPLRQILLGFICCAFFMLVFYMITLSPRLSCITVSGILLILSTANHYVYEFRGSELCPSDLMTIGTARNVADKYTFSLPGQVLYSWLIFVIYVIVLLLLPSIKTERRIGGRVMTFAIMCLLGLFFHIESPKITVQHFLHGGSYWNGYLLNFALEVKETIVHKPEGYSLEAIQEIGEDYYQGSGDSTIGEDRQPDIIVIMDEAYSDLGVLGEELRTNIPVSPFISSLREDTTYGYALTSVYGGGTPNSEYEFLTGNTLLFLKGIIYQQYLRKPVYSLVSMLKDRGYKCIAMHPYLSSGWRRNMVWPNLLFDECLFIDDFPQQNLVRGLVSDREMFSTVLDTYRSQKMTDDKPVFLFGVTMQNHSGYDYDGEGFHNKVELQGYQNEYPDVEQYLTLINETDQAVESFLKEIEKIDRDIIVVFYGDHQPALDERFLQEIHGGPFDTLEDKQLLQQVPFFIWTNYDSGTTDVGLTSLNYLSNYLLEKADMGLPPYNQFLKDMEGVSPYMNSHGFYSTAADRFLEYPDAEGKEKNWLDWYWILEYNSLIDIKNLDTHFFPLNK